MAEAEERAKLAAEALEQAKTLAGEGTMNDLEFLESVSRSDSLVDHPDNCGCCAMNIIMAQTARDMLANGEIEDGIRKWSDESRRRWEESKYYKLYQEEKAAGRDPHKAFEERGWEM